MREGKIFAGVLLALLALVGTTEAQRLQVGKLVIRTTTRISPRALPENVDAPVTMLNSTGISMTDGSAPPQLRKLVLKFDRHGHVETRGLAVCTVAELEGTTTAEARQRCAGAIVGKGMGRAAIESEGQKPIPISSPLTLFNGPRTHGNPTVIAHGYETIPAPAAVIVPMEIEKVRNGAFGFRVVAEIPPIAEGRGSVLLAKMTVGRTWKRGGRTFSFVSARCRAGRLQTRGSLSFADGSFIPGAIIQGCRAQA